jgi:hypothetical protein
MLLPPARLTCIEVRRRIEQNSRTRPPYVRAIDENGYEHDIVMKVRHPDVNVGHYEGTSLGCELICMVLCRALGLTVPDHFIVEIPRGLGDAIREESLRRLITRNTGLNFGTTFIEGSNSWVALEEEEPLSYSLLTTLEDVLVFDSTVINGDRKLDKPNLLWNGSDLMPIDHSLALPVHQWTDEQLAESPLFPEAEIQAHCSFLNIRGQEREFSALLQSWRDGVSPEDITELRTFIPASWEQREGHLDRIFNFLQQRSGRFDAVTEDLRRIMK